jgi:hypothetical protein
VGEAASAAPPITDASKASLILPMMKYPPVLSRQHSGHAAARVARFSLFLAGILAYFAGP